MAARDSFFILRSIALARKRQGFTHPNPPVGAVIVRDGRIVATGWHERAGAPHAEAMALTLAGERARGAELFVSLEPCNHHGRTPPCTEAILGAGIRRVVFSVADPNPNVAGGGAEFLRANGVEVEGGVCEEVGAELIAPWVSVVQRKRPWITLKLALSAEGLIAPEGTGNYWLSSAPSVAAVQRLRARSDAILVGGNTIRLDDPLLTNRLGWGKAPLRIVLSRTGEIPATAKVLSDRSVETIVLSSFVQLSGTLERYQISNLLCEGGGALSKTLIRERLVDRLILFRTTKNIGASGVTWWPEELAELEGFKLIRNQRSGQDLREEWGRRGAR